MLLSLPGALDRKRGRLLNSRVVDEKVSNPDAIARQRMFA
jgi:hypothetical protein